MYKGLARVYDRLMADFDYPAWAQYYMALIGRYGGEKPRTICECACGTGSMALALSEMGISVVGVDLSWEMLAVAQQKARTRGISAPFVMQDMRALALPRPVDAILCPCDGVNYLLYKRDLEQFFAAAYLNLKPGGVLAFDVSSEHKLKKQAEQSQFFEDTEELTYLWTNAWDGERRVVKMDLCFFEPRPDGRYSRFDEYQEQRAHTQEELERALTNAGFTGILCFGNQHFKEPTDTEDRIHIAAQRPK